MTDDTVVVQLFKDDVASEMVEEHAGRVRWVDLGSSASLSGKKLQQEFFGTRKSYNWKGDLIGGSYFKEWRDVPEEKP